MSIENGMEELPNGTRKHANWLDAPANPTSKEDTMKTNNNEANIESCWGGPLQPTFPSHVQVVCRIHGHIMASCTPQAEGGNCVNTNPRFTKYEDCLSVCPEHEWTDQELGIKPEDTTPKEDTTMNKTTIYIEFTTNAKDPEVTGNHLIDWLRVDLHALRPMRYLGGPILTPTAELSNHTPVSMNAVFQTTEEIKSEGALKPWFENKMTTNAYATVVNNITINTSKEDNIVLDDIDGQMNYATEEQINQQGEQLSFTMPENLVITNVVLDGNTGNIKSFTLKEDNNMNTTEAKKAIFDKWWAANSVAYLPTPRETIVSLLKKLSTDGDQGDYAYYTNPYITAQIDWALNNMLWTDSSRQLVLNHYNPMVPKEDINMSINQPEEFRLPDPNDNYRISFRMTEEAEWEVEIERPTLNQAMHWIADQVNTVGEFKVEQIVGDQVFVINIDHHKEAKVHEYKLRIQEQEARIITNIIPPVEQLALDTYQQALEDGKQEVIALKYQKEATIKYIQEKQGVLTKGVHLVPLFTSETWQYALLMQRIVRIGGYFRITTFEKKALKNLKEEYINSMISSSSFAFAEGDNLTIFTVWDRDKQQVKWDDFESYIGIKIRNSAKLGKRLKELTRYTLFWDIMTKPLNILRVEFDPDDEIAVDGIGCMSQSAFLRMVSNIPVDQVRNRNYGLVKSGEIVRVNFRYVFNDEKNDESGEIKGDVIITPDPVLKAAYPEYYAEHGKVPDLVQPSINGKMVNLKHELSTDGTWHIMTANPHHAHHQPMTNDQILSIFSNNEVEPWAFPKEQLKEDHMSFIDEVYQDMKDGNFPKFMTAEWMSDATGNTRMDPDRLAARIQQLSVRWNMAGRSLLESAHFIRMVGNGFWARLNAAIRRTKVMVPIRHAAYVHVTSLSIITLCGYDPAEEGYDTSKCFYYERAHSWVKPDSIFIRDFARHGGEDGDDSEIVMIRNVLFPDGIEKVMAIAVRMPTAWGEWSMVEVDTTGFPFYNTWNEMPTVIYADRPEFLEEMVQSVEGLPYSNVEIPDIYSPEWCQYQVTLIVQNPGVGRIINPMIAYYATVHSYFPEQLASTEDFVDCLKQTPDEDAFVAINGEIERMIKEIVYSGAVIDEHIYKTRLQEVELPEDTDTTVTNEGFFTEMFRFTKDALADWGQKVNEMATNREEIPKLNALTLPETIPVLDAKGAEVQVKPLEHAKWMLANFNIELARYRNLPVGEARRQFSGHLNRNVVNYLTAQPVQSRHWLLVASYQAIWQTKGRKDNFIFQTPLDSFEKSVMDLFIITLYHLGLAKVQLEDGSWKWKEEKKED